MGSYQLQEQVPQSDDSQGECYLATHETSGAAALVRKRTAAEDAAARRDLRVLFSSSAPLGYDAMQVEDTPWSVAPDRQSVESLLFTFEGLHEAVRRMARAVSDTRERLPRWRLGLALASSDSRALVGITCGRPQVVLGPTVSDTSRPTSPTSRLTPSAGSPGRTDYRRRVHVRPPM